MVTPSTAAIASRMAATTSGRRPSEKFGTHSTRRMAGSGKRKRGPGKRRGVNVNPSPFTLHAANDLHQPPVRAGVAGDQTRVVDSCRGASEIRRDAAGFADQQNAGGNVPRGEGDFPEALEPAGGDAGEIERRGAGATDARALAHDA